ncbi:MAG TPA: beta-N-acetylhexosaminidase [Dehalococcoidia bacterium]|nr:beta-N-acetylhexosaminidase [Dehalococcoidia bacterium]
MPAAFLAACARGDPAPTPTAPSTTTPVATMTPAPTPTPVVPIENKIGAMIAVGFNGTTVGPESPIYGDIVSGRLGHVVLFERNVTSPAQLQALDASLQALSSGKMLIGTDQEGGYVARLRPANGFPETPTARALGQRDDVDYTKRQASAMAATLKAAGVNLNLAPVVDLDVNPNNPAIGAFGRSFSADPAVVVRQAGAFIDAHHEAGLLTTLKHFPGHGSSTADSHKGFVDVTNTWSEVELEPFRQLIAAGKADAVMTAHIFNARLDPEHPATLSQKTITGVLRQQLGYDGVVITDDLQMAAIREYYGFEASVELAVQAGADIIAIANSLIYEPYGHTRAFDTIYGAVAAGRISAARIDESYRRIYRLKARL